MSSDLKGIPEDWDSLEERSVETEGEPAIPPVTHPAEGSPLAISLMAASWADLVGMLAVCTAALIAVLALGEPPALSVFPWAVALALAWWVFAAYVLVVVRQGTPGMLLAGIVFEQAVSARRVPWVLVAAVLGVATLGLTGLIGPRSSPLRLAAASEIVNIGED